MSDVPQVPPSAVRDGSTIEALVGTSLADVLAPLTGRVRDAVVRTATAAGHWNALVRAHPAPNAHDPTRVEMDAARTQLCDAVSTLAARMRRDGLPPQRMLVVVKETVRTAAPHAADGLAARDLMNDAVRCGIDAYYAAN